MNTTKIHVAEGSPPPTPGGVNNLVDSSTSTPKAQGLTLSPLPDEAVVGKKLKSPSGKTKRRKKVKKVVSGSATKELPPEVIPSADVSNNKMPDPVPLHDKACNVASESAESSIQMSGPPRQGEPKRRKSFTKTRSRNKGELSLNCTQVALDHKVS